MVLVYSANIKKKWKEGNGKRKEGKGKRKEGKGKRERHLSPVGATY